MFQPKSALSKNHKNLSLTLPRTNKPKHVTASVPVPASAAGPPSQEPQHVSHYEHGPAQILPNLFLGACHNAQRPELLDRHGIACILNVAHEIERPMSSTRSIRYHHLRWTHTQSNLARREFDKAIRVLEAAHHTNTTVLVHCQSGVERSAALVIAYILHLSRQPAAARGSVGKKKLTLWEAYDFVRERAPAIRPNMELLYQLSEFESLSSPHRSVTTRVRRSGSVNANSTIRKKTSTSSGIASNRSRPRAASFRSPAVYRQQQHELPVPPLPALPTLVPARETPSSAPIDDSVWLVVLMACVNMSVLFAQQQRFHRQLRPAASAAAAITASVSSPLSSSSSSSAKPCLNLAPSEPSTPMSPLFLHSLFPIC